MNGALIAVAGVVLLIATGASGIPGQAVAETFGGYADTLIFSVVPQDQAVASLSSGEVDMYLYSLDTATDKQAARDDPNINAMNVRAGSRALILNPCEPSDGSFNPFTIREIREAMHWATDREFIRSEIAGGFAIPMITPYISSDPEYLADPEFFATLEAKYAYNPGRARSQVDSAMARVPEATFDAATNQWLINGNNIEVIIVQRVEDFRFEIGAYAATEVESLGFTPVLDPSTFSEALAKVYFSNSTIGQWHIYTEGWGSSGFGQFDDSLAPFFFNGDFGSAIWDCYDPPPSLTIPCEALREGFYANEDERRELVRQCVTEGMREGVRIFLLTDTDVYAFNRAVSNTVFSESVGPHQPFAVRTTIKNRVPGGTLYIAQPIHTGSAWNLYGGFQDVFSRNQLYSITDFGTYRHPHAHEVLPVRAEFRVTSAGPDGHFKVPSSALTFDVAMNTFVSVQSGVTSQSFVDFDMLFGEWHHEETMSMDDVLAHIAMLSRMANGDLSAENPSTAAQIYLTRWGTSFRGFEILGEDSIRVWYNSFHEDESVVAERADVFPWYPWELNAIMTESVLAGETAFDDTSAGMLDREPLDLAKGPTFAFLDPRLAASTATSAIPGQLLPWVTPVEAGARWAALNDWRHPQIGCSEEPVWTCNYYVSQGPFFLAEYLTGPEGARYVAKRTGYPIEQGAWDFLGPGPIIDVQFGTPPEVIQTFPATFRFTTTVDGRAYDRIESTAWLVSDPEANEVLFTGEAARNGLGVWQFTLDPRQTTALFEGSYEARAIVVGMESRYPATSQVSFTSLSLASALLSDMTCTLETCHPFQSIQETLAELNVRTQHALEVAREAARLTNQLAIVAIGALVLAAAATAGSWIQWRRGHPRER